MTTHASLCTGIGGLDLAIEQHYDAETIWQAENEPACARVLAHHWPGVPNVGDITKAAWHDLPSPDVLSAGFPCQDISYAGRGAGLDGDRSGLWWTVRDAIGVLRPRIVVLENVAALLARGGPAVVGALAGLGYDCRWGVVRAADAGAPHRRARWFCVAHTGGVGRGSRTGLRPDDPRRLRRPRPGDSDRSAPDTGGAGTGRDRRSPPPPQEPDRRGEPGHTDSPGVRGTPAADATLHDRSGSDDREPTMVGPIARTSIGDHAGNPPAGVHIVGRGARVEWGPYAAAIRRWEHITGEPAPDPLDGRRLNPELSRWMMGLPAGWLNGMTRTQALRAAGNAVCPQQALLALSLLEQMDAAA